MKKVLVIEDNKQVAMALTVRLKSAGYQVITVYDAVMAVSMAVKHQPDLALIDIALPAGNGLWVAERMRELAPTAGMPMIFLTASKKPGLRERATELGAAAFFEKPYEAEALMASVRTALGEG
ncbi:MAG: response regulator [Planctomycetota bacterium]